MTEDQKVLAIAREIAMKIHRIADKTGMSPDVVLSASVGIFAKALSNPESGDVA